jgi:hypothetical protein
VTKLRRRNVPIRYYLYISQAKVDSLVAQIPPPFTRSFETEIRANAGILSAGLKGVAPAAPPELAAKAGILGDYIEKTEAVGSISEPGRYIRDVASLRYGVVREYASGLAFFGGVADGAKVGLIGSPSSLVGAVPDGDANHAPYYYTLRFLSGLADADVDTSPPVSQPPYYSFEQAVDIALAALPPMPSRLEFLAKTLFRQPGVLLATPIYVALAD